MKPYNVMNNTIDDGVVKTELSKATNLQRIHPSKIVNRRFIKEMIMTIATMKLCDFHLFQFKDDKTVWTYFDRSNPIQAKEIKGLFAVAVNQTKKNEMHPTRIKYPCNHYVSSSNARMISTLESIDIKEPIFMIAYTPGYLLFDGNYFDENTMCRAMIDFRPRKRTSVIRKVKGLENIIFRTKQLSTISKAAFNF